MDYAQALVDFINKNGVAGAVLIFVAYFSTSKVWPWLTKEYWPALSKREDERNSIMKVMSETLIELKVAQANIAGKIDRNYDATRGDIRVMLESMAALHLRFNTPAISGAAVEEAITKAIDKEKGKG